MRFQALGYVTWSDVECAVCQVDIIRFNDDNTIGYNYRSKRVLYVILR